MKIIITFIILFIMPFSSSMADTSFTEVYRQSIRITDQIDALKHTLSQEQLNQVKEQFDKIVTILKNQNPVNCGESRVVYREVYSFATDYNGMGLSQSQARALAEEISNKTCAKPYLENFKSSYTWSASYDGMGNSRNQARDFAYLISNYEENKKWPNTTLNCFMEEYQYATSYEGMGLPKKQAEAFATEQCLK